MPHDMSFAAETTADSANQRNFFKVEQWSKDDQHVERLLHVGNRIDAARAVFMRQSNTGHAVAIPSGSGAVW
jgi:hypothetical protein